ncbi:hypothetical protein QBC37DRAFT_33509 [Rhypophila decipiens]|uniref:Uncharacterized protein n=1 Tax=Rhypophila decipiens TaxID=261697 RepID=A0AAN6YFT9_9PEZI|nr:hypothetical protein QBC37DRAFT_33509 [Rhypophila decipiens]
MSPGRLVSQASGRRSSVLGKLNHNTRASRVLSGSSPFSIFRNRKKWKVANQRRQQAVLCAGSWVDAHCCACKSIVAQPHNERVASGSQKLGHSAKRRIRSFKVGSCDSSIATVSGEPRIEKKKKEAEINAAKSNGRKEQQGRNFSTVSVRTVHTYGVSEMDGAAGVWTEKERIHTVSTPCIHRRACTALCNPHQCTARIVQESSQNHSRSLSYTMCPWRKISSNEPLALETKPELISSRRGRASTASFSRSYSFSSPNASDVSSF